MDIELLRSELSKRVVTVTFRKKDGEIRVMKCTTNMDAVPPSQWPSGNRTLSEATKLNNLQVYDVEANGWRSFIAANVLEVV